MRRILASALVSVLSGFFLTILIFMFALFYALARGKTTHIPGVIDYVSSSEAMSVQPDGALYITLIVLAIASFPIAWMISRKVSRRE